MAYGIAAYNSNGNEVLSTYTPHNFLKFVQPTTVTGRHTVTVPELPAGSQMEVVIQCGCGAPNQYYYIDEITISGNTFTYNVVAGGSGNTNFFYAANNATFAIFSKR